MMSIQANKLELIEWISRLNDSLIIGKLIKMKEDYASSKDWWDSLEQDEIESINRGLQDFEKGKFHSHETAQSIYGKHL